MKIVDVKTAVVEGNFDWPLIRVETDEEIYGYGEVRDAGSKWLALKLKPYLVGADPTDVERVFRKIRHFGGRGRQGGGVSGIEMALWDIAGKVYGVPVYKLLGGKIRDKIPIYCDCHAGKPIASSVDYQLDEVNCTPEAYAENAHRIKKMGFNLLKFDLGATVAALVPGGYVNGHVTHRGLKYQVSIVEALRDAVGEDTELALDCGQGTVDAAIRFGNAMEPYDLAWLEDLIGYGTVREYREITSSIKTANLTGEDRYTRRAFRGLIEKHAIRVLGPDLATAGGIAETKKIAELAELHGLKVALHFAGSPLSMMANVHVAATTPNVVTVEFHAVALPWWDSLVKGVEKPIIKDGYIKVPESPGLGVELNDEEIKKHLKPGESYFK